MENLLVQFASSSSKTLRTQNISDPEKCCGLVFVLMFGLVGFFFFNLRNFELFAEALTADHLTFENLKCVMLQNQILSKSLNISEHF